MSDEPEVEVSMTRESYAHRWQPRPAAPAPRRPAAPPPAPPDITERIDQMFERLGRNVGPQTSTQKFALLPSLDQARLLRAASDQEFVTFARHARPVIRKQAQDERRARQMPGRIGP